MGDIERKVHVLGTSTPCPDEPYLGTYRILRKPIWKPSSICAWRDHRFHRPPAGYRSLWSIASSVFRLQADKVRGANDQNLGAYHGACLRSTDGEQLIIMAQSYQTCAQSRQWSAPTRSDFKNSGGQQTVQHGELIPTLVGMADGGL